MKTKFKIKKRTDVFIIIAAVILTAAVPLLLFRRRQVSFTELKPENGILNIEEINFSDEVFNVVNCWDFYPERLYTSADFASGVKENPVLAGRDISSDDVPFGTYRLVLKGQRGFVLTMCSFSIDYATAVFVNGAEVVRFGNIADNAADSSPGGGFMTIPVHADENGEAEIIYHYSNFVHKEGGAIPPTYISAPQNIESYKTGNALASVGLSGAMLILAMYFLLAASVGHQSSYAALAFCCALAAFRDNLFWGTYFLPPEASWEFTYRVSLTVSALLPLSFLILLHCLYPDKRRAVHYIYAGLVLSDVLLMQFFKTEFCVYFSRISYFISLPYFVYSVYRMIRAFVKKTYKIRKPDILTLSGLSILFVSVIAEALTAGRLSFATRFGFTPSGMLICVFLIAVSVSLKIQKQKEALAESRTRGEMLERMNALNLDFLHKTAHELKTPLTVISGYAQLAGMQLAGNTLSEETPENLRIIHREAMRLSDLVTNLLDYSYGKENQTVFKTVNVASLLDSVRAICTPMCLKNNNNVVVTGKECADIYGNNEMLLQIFINLVVNANRHTENGTIYIDADDKDSCEYLIFRVRDTGCGISDEIKSHLFEKGFSDDGSSGLGLFVCREAVEAQGGQIGLEKTGPDGTTFAFTVLKRRLEQ